MLHYTLSLQKTLKNSKISAEYLSISPTYLKSIMPRNNKAKKTQKKTKTKTITKKKKPQKIKLKLKKKKSTKNIILGLIKNNLNSSDSSSDNIEIVHSSKKGLQENQLYIFEGNKLKPVQIAESSEESEEYLPDSDSSIPCSRSRNKLPQKKNPKIKESMIRRKANQTIRGKQQFEQRARMDAILTERNKYCLIDYYEDTNNRTDKLKNFEVGRISSIYSNRPGNYIFRLSRGTAYHDNVQICVDEDLFMTCSCPDWNHTCKSLGVMCSHLCYLTRFILKIPQYSIVDNQFQDTLMFYSKLKNLKIDYDDELVFDSVKSTSCLLCYRKKIKAPGLFGENRLTKCPQCSNTLHESCGSEWFKKSRKKQCPFCGSKYFKYLFG